MISILVLELALYNQREHLYLFDNCIYEEQDVCSLRKLISSFLFTSYLYESKHFILRLSFHKLKSEKNSKGTCKFSTYSRGSVQELPAKSDSSALSICVCNNQTSLERGER